MELSDDLKEMVAAIQALRSDAIESAKANNALSGFYPSEFGEEIFEKWIRTPTCSTDDLVNEIIAHYKQNALCGDESDMLAQENKLGVTDSRQLRQIEADITTLRMAELELM